MSASCWARRSHRPSATSAASAATARHWCRWTRRWWRLRSTSPAAPCLPGRPPSAVPTIGTMDTELFEEFFRAFAHNALITLHVTKKAGRNAHHVAEGCFKARCPRPCAWRSSWIRAAAGVHTRPPRGRCEGIYTAHIHAAPITGAGDRRGSAGVGSCSARSGYSAHAALDSPAPSYLAAVLVAICVACHRHRYRPLCSPSCPVCRHRLVRSTILRRWSLGPRPVPPGPCRGRAHPRRGISSASSRVHGPRSGRSRRMMRVAVVDYGSGNLTSAARALARAAELSGIDGRRHRHRRPGGRWPRPTASCCRARARSPTAPPGSPRSMACGTRSTPLPPPAGPFLGICVGMQLMAERGLEHTTTPGFGWVARRRGGDGGNRPAPAADGLERARFRRRAATPCWTACGPATTSTSSTATRCAVPGPAR